MTHITIEKEKLEKVFYALTAAKHGNLDHEWTEEVLAICKQALAAPTVQEPVATVIEELEHDGEGFCAKVRWLYNPVPVGETLSWEQPK
jgi:hypothetical protein